MMFDQKNKIWAQLPMAKGNSKGERKARSITKVGQDMGSMWCSKNRSTSSLPKFEIIHTSKSLTTWERTPKGTINSENVHITRKRGIKLRIAELWRFFLISLSKRNIWRRSLAKKRLEKKNLRLTKSQVWSEQRRNGLHLGGRLSFGHYSHDRGPKSP